MTTTFHPGEYEYPVEMPELQIVPVESPAREIDRWPAWIIINPPVDDDGNYAPHEWRN